MGKSRDQHNILVFKLWIDSHVIREWEGLERARMYVQNATERVDNPNLLRLAVYERTNNGLQPLVDKGAMGTDNIYRALDELKHD